MYPLWFRATHLNRSWIFSQMTIVEGKRVLFRLTQLNYFISWLKYSFCFVHLINPLWMKRTLYPEKCLSRYNYQYKDISIMCTTHETHPIIAQQHTRICLQCCWSSMPQLPLYSKGMCSISITYNDPSLSSVYWVMLTATCHQQVPCGAIYQYRVQTLRRQLTPDTAWPRVLRAES